MKYVKNKKRKTIISLLILISLVMTTGTFAYWASNVEGTQENAIGSLTIGSASGVETVFELSNELNYGGYLVPKGQLNNSEEGSVDEVLLSYSLNWREKSDVSQLDGSEVTGKVSMNHYLIIKRNDVLIDSNVYPEIYDLVDVYYHVDNHNQLILNGDSEVFNFTITMDEPSNQFEYDLISNATVQVVFEFRIYDNFIEINDQQVDDEETEPFEGPGFDIKEKVVYLEYGESLPADNAVAYNSNGEILNGVWTTGSINNWKLGEYNIRYQVYSSYDNKMLTSEEVTVIVVDTTSPEITIIGEEVINLQQGDDFTDYWGAWAIDNVTHNVNVETTGLNEIDTDTPGTYYITYTAEDSSGNVSSVIRTIIVE